MADQPFKARLVQDGEAINYTPVADVPAGTVVQRGGIIGFTHLNIVAGDLGALEVSEKVYEVVKDASVFADGMDVYYNPTGNPVGGTAGSGAASSTPSGIYLGLALIEQLSTGLTGSPTVRVLHQKNRAAGGAVGTGTVAALGTIQGDAAPLAAGFNFVTGADAAKGVILPDLPAGSVVEVKNGANAVLKVWPAVGDAINAIAANGALSMAAFTSASFRKYDAVTWYTTPLVPS